MQFILRIIVRNGLFLFYLLLAIIAFTFTFRQRVYHKSVVDKAGTEFTGFMDDKISGMTQFIHLDKTNRQLQEENAELRILLEKLKTERSAMHSVRDSISNPEFHQIYSFIPVEIVNNSVMQTHNMMTINKGSRQGVRPGMGLISSNGVLGFVYKTSDNYARVMSTLNTNTRITAQIKKNQYFGTLIWNGKDPRFLQLQEIPKYIPIEIGDTIETDGKSGAVPGGIMIGTVAESEINELTGGLEIEVKLKEDFARLRYGQVVVNLQRQEIIKVERNDSTSNAQF